MKSFFISTFLKLLFYQTKATSFSEKEIAHYEALFAQATNGDGIIICPISIQKQRFIQYISSKKKILLHGSNNANISISRLNSRHEGVSLLTWRLIADC